MFSSLITGESCEDLQNPDPFFIGDPEASAVLLAQGAVRGTPVY